MSNERYFFTILVMFINIYKVASLQNMIFGIFKENELLSGQTETISDYRSTIECAAGCLTHTDLPCLSFAFNKHRQECYFYNFKATNTSNTLPDVGTRVFKRNRRCISSIRFKNVYEKYFHHNSVDDEVQCALRCDQTAECTFYLWRPAFCSLFKPPVILAKENVTEEVCVENCIANLQCVAMNFAVRNSRCFHFSKPLSHFTVINTANNNSIGDVTDC